MTYNEICLALADAGIENDRGEAAMLICRFCNKTKADLLLCRDEDYESQELEDAVIKRCSHYPLQYILGYWDFCHETYRITKDTLIPRPDTECLVEQAVRLLPENARFIDLCTGSGCVAISTLASRPDCRAVATDLFEDTLAIARENAETNGVGDRIGFACQDVLCPDFMDKLGNFDFILSNPPYIATDKLALLEEELTYEPIAALDGGADGLDFYRTIVGGYGKYLRQGGGMLFEIGYDQAKSLQEIADNNGYTCQIFKDYGGNDRVAFLSRENKTNEKEEITNEANT